MANNRQYITTIDNIKSTHFATLLIVLFIVFLGAPLFLEWRGGSSGSSVADYADELQQIALDQQVQTQLRAYLNFENARDNKCTVDTRFEKTAWFLQYARLVIEQEPMSCPECDRHSYSQGDACARWWQPKPHPIYMYRPPRAFSEDKLIPTSLHIPACPFGQEKKHANRCTLKYKKLIEALDKLRLVYFPRGGTELGVVRQSAYISADGDIDMCVDMPSPMLLEKLESTGIKPAPHIVSKGSRGSEVHWKVIGCPEVHMVYNDWMSHDMDQQPRPEDVCKCNLNSLELLCHKNAVQRTYMTYGPSWKLPLSIKSNDDPFVFHGKKLGWEKHNQVRDLKVLKPLVDPKTGMIEAHNVRSIDQSIHIPEDEMPLILAQLNTFANAVGLFGQRFYRYRES